MVAVIDGNCYCADRTLSGPHPALRPPDEILQLSRSNEGGR
jgi:hypothetical protein